MKNNLSLRKMFYSELNRSEIIHAFIVNKSHFFFGKAPAEGDFFHLNHKKKLPAQHERFLSLCLRFRSFVLFKFPLLVKKRLIRGMIYSWAMISSLC